MSKLRKAGVLALAAAFAVGGASAALAKAHDQGVADGTRIDPRSVIGQLDGRGVSSVVSGGLRGVDASRDKAGNSVEPIGAPGQDVKR